MRSIKFIVTLFVSLSWTNVPITSIGEFNLTVFWPAFLLALIANPFLMSRLHLPTLANPWLVGVALMATAALINISQSKVTSLAYSLGWIFYSMWLMNSADKLSPALVDRMLRIVLISFAASVGLGLFFIAFKLPTSHIEYLVGWVGDSRTGEIRFQGPSSEPSYAAIIVSVSGLALLRLRSLIGNLEETRRETLILLALIAGLDVLFRSLFGVLAGAILASAYVSSHRSTSPRLLIASFAVVAAAAMFVTLPSDSRLGQVLPLLSEMNLAELNYIDNSAYMRLGPAVQFFSESSVFSLNFWIGHGAGQSEFYFGNLFGHLAGNDVVTMKLGFIPAFIYDWGMLTAAAFILFGMRACAGPLSVQARLIYFISLVNCNFNTQLFWYITTAMILSAPGTLNAHVRTGPRRRAMA